MGIIVIIISIIFIGIGILVKSNPNLISGYSTMSEEEKQNVDILGLSTLLRNGFILIALVNILVYFTFYFLKLKFYADSSLIFTLFGGIIIIVIQSNKYDKNKKSKQKNKFVVILLSALTIGASVLFYYGTASSEVIFSDNSFEITKMYGVERNYSDIKNIVLLDTMPEIIIKTNGFNLGNITKGEFKLQKYGYCSLFLETQSAPIIMLEFNDKKHIFINYSSAEKTSEVYDKFNNALIKDNE
jgi:hypothetical protein